MKDRFDEFYSTYRKKLKDSKYKYLAYRKAEDEHVKKHGRRRYMGWGSFRAEKHRRLKNQNN